MHVLCMYVCIYRRAESTGSTIYICMHDVCMYYVCMYVCVTFGVYRFRALMVMVVRLSVSL